MIYFNQQITVLEQEKPTRELKEGEKRAELPENTIRRELEKENQRKMIKLTSELQEKMKAKYSDRLKEWQVL